MEKIDIAIIGGGVIGLAISAEVARDKRDAFIFEKVGIIAAKMDELAYNMDFSLQKLRGKIVLNISTIDLKDIQKVKDIIKLVFQKELGMGQFLAIGKYPSQCGGDEQYTHYPEVTFIVGNE